MEWPNGHPYHERGCAHGIMSLFKAKGSSKDEIRVRQNSMLSEVKELDDLCSQGLFDYTFVNCFTEKSKQDFCNLVDMLIPKEETK